MDQIIKPEQRIILINQDYDYATPTLKNLVDKYASDLDTHFRIDDFLLLNVEDMAAFFKPFPQLLEQGIKKYKKGTFRYDLKGRIRIPSSKRFPIFHVDRFNDEEPWINQLNRADILVGIDYVVLTSIQTLTDEEVWSDGYSTREDTLDDNKKYYPNLTLTDSASFFAFKEVYANMSLSQKREYLGLDKKRGGFIKQP
ncbi:hypothetical protein COV13_03015 [Candidatus Woesearchaeota archaeon CG10_big_fil_rev_8_21_14_0_10_32_9]|nr:MAG: hypothetical protein COV13_03015 [Candidatus Woesearchaeota archaeon CG10_big_fil_rev_8_21_14_0_10_32_9]